MAPPVGRRSAMEDSRRKIFVDTGGPLMEAVTKGSGCSLNAPSHLGTSAPSHVSPSPSTRPVRCSALRRAQSRYKRTLPPWLTGFPKAAASPKIVLEYLSGRCRSSGAPRKELSPLNAAKRSSFCWKIAANPPKSCNHSTHSILQSHGHLPATRPLRG